MISFPAWWERGLFDPKQSLRSYGCQISVFAASLLLLVSLGIVKIITHFQRSLPDLPEQTELPSYVTFQESLSLTVTVLMVIRWLFDICFLHWTDCKPHEDRDHFFSSPAYFQCLVQYLAQNGFSANIWEMNKHMNQSSTHLFKTCTQKTHSHRWQWPKLLPLSDLSLNKAQTSDVEEEKKKSWSRSFPTWTWSAWISLDFAPNFLCGFRQVAHLLSVGSIMYGSRSVCGSGNWRCLNKYRIWLHWIKPLNQIPFEVLILKLWDTILQGRIGEGEPDIEQSGSVQGGYFSGISAPRWNKKKGFAGCLFEVTSRQKIACLSFGVYFVISTVRCQLKAILPTIRECYWIKTVDVEGALSRICFERANRESHKSQRVHILRHWVGTSQTEY